MEIASRKEGDTEGDMELSQALAIFLAVNVITGAEGQG